MNPYDINYIKLKETKLINIINKEKTVTQVAEELAVTRKTIHIWLIRYKRFGIDGLLNKRMDTTYPFGYGVEKVTYTAIDDATRIVYAYTYDKANAVNTVGFLKRLKARLPFTILKIKTDQGKEFLNNLTKKYLKESGIVHRANTPYSPEENGKIERFHGTLNSKCFRFGFTPDESLDDFNYKLTLFLHYYNHIKKHRGLGMNSQAPHERLRELRLGRGKKA